VATRSTSLGTAIVAWLWEHRCTGSRCLLNSLDLARMNDLTRYPDDPLTCSD
jgi:hypothetical protein